MKDFVGALGGALTFKGGRFLIVECGVRQGKPYACVDPSLEELESLITRHMAEHGVPSFHGVDGRWFLTILGEDYPYEFPAD